MWLRVWVLVLAMAMLVSGLYATMAQAQVQTNDPIGVITAFELARNRREVDTALNYFADDASVTQRTATFTGKDEIRRYLEAATGRTRFLVVSDRQVSGDRVSWTERITSSQSFSISQGSGGFEVTVEAMVHDGKIQSLSYAGVGQSLRIDPSADARGQVPAIFGLGAVALFLSGLLLLASGPPAGRPSETPSRLRGRLMQDLKGWSSSQTRA
jgi:hypothetical protein